MVLVIIRAKLLMSFCAALMGCTIASPVITKGSYKGLTNSDPSKGTVFVYRESAFTGSTNQYDVMMDGGLVGSLPNGTFFSIEADPGKYKVEPRTLTAFGFGKGDAITVNAGKPHCLKLTLNFCLQCKSANINFVDLQQCESEMKSLREVQLK